MKRKSIVILCTVCLLTVACGKETSSNQPDASTSPVAESNAQASKNSGSFVAGEHSTQGNVRLVTENGKRYLMLDRAFKTDFGPDLFVLLHRSNPPKQYRSQDYVNLGRLQGTSGAQRYALPANVNLAEFRSVAIWCRAFNVTFGYAPFSD